MDQREFVVQARVATEVLDAWVAAGWLSPHRNGNGRQFSDIDLARANLIRDLHDLGVNDEGIPVVLDLVDQLYGLRRVVRELLSTIKTRHREQDRP